MTNPTSDLVDQIAHILTEVRSRESEDELEKLSCVLETLSGAASWGVMAIRARKQGWSQQASNCVETSEGYIGAARELARIFESGTDEYFRSR